MADVDDSAGPALWKIERVMLPFVENVALWPVAFAVFGHASLLAAIAILFVARDGSAGSITTIALLSGGTFWLVAREWRRHGRPRGISILLALTWIGAAICAWAADRSGAF